MLCKSAFLIMGRESLVTLKKAYASKDRIVLRDVRSKNIKARQTYDTVQPCRSFL